MRGRFVLVLCLSVLFVGSYAGSLKKDVRKKSEHFCQVEDLHFLLSFAEASMSQTVSTLSIVNQSASACRLKNPPRFYTTIDSDIKPLPYDYSMKKDGLMLQAGASFKFMLHATACGNFGGKLSYLNRPDVGKTILYEYDEKICLVQRRYDGYRCNAKISIINHTKIP